MIKTITLYIRRYTQFFRNWLILWRTKLKLGDSVVYKLGSVPYYGKIVKDTQISAFYRQYKGAAIAIQCDKASNHFFAWLDVSHKNITKI